MRRERHAILGDILAEVERAGHFGETRVTAVAQRANLPHDRLMGYLLELHRAGLLTRQATITEEGREFLRSYREWCDALDRFGLAAGVGARAVGAGLR